MTDESYQKLLASVIEGQDYLAWELEDAAQKRNDFSGQIVGRLSSSGDAIDLEEIAELVAASEGGLDWSPIDRFLDTIPADLLRAPIEWWLDMQSAEQIPEKWGLVRYLDTFELRSQPYFPCRHPSSLRKLRILHLEDDILDRHALADANQLEELILRPAPESSPHPKLGPPENYFTSISKLKLWSGELPFSTDLSAFTLVPNLEKLYLTLCNNKAKIFDISAITALKKLTHLHLRSWNSGVGGLETLSELKQLEFLHLGGFYEGLATLPPLPELRKLELVEFSAHAPIKIPPELLSLHLEQCKDLKDLKFLACLQKLENISLAHLPALTDISGLTELPHLQKISLRNCPKVMDRELLLPGRIEVKIS